MSDFGSDPLAPDLPGAPPPTPTAGPFGPQWPSSPPSSYQPPPFTQHAAPSAAYPQAGYPPGAPPPVGYMPMPGFVQKPPRPPVRVGSLLLIVGGVVLVTGSFLRWFTLGEVHYNGFGSTNAGGAFDIDMNDGAAYVFFGVLSLGFGIAQLAARKVLAVAIIATVFASFAALAAINDVNDLGDLEMFGDLFGGFSRGPGLWVVLLGSLIALGGAIATLSARRRWPTPT